jgi:hypothetical protein
MKKVDEATGMTIEVPSNTAIRSKFPYPGFWAAVYPNLSTAISKHALPATGRADIDRSLGLLIQMMNGEQAIILTERIYYIGELLDLNYTLPVEGRSGLTLGYIKASQDGGRMQIAAKLFDAPIRAILAQAQGKTLADNSMSNILSEQASYERELESLTRQLRDLEQKASTRDALNQLAILGEQKMNHAAMLQKDIAMRANQILQIQSLRTEYATMEKQHNNDAVEVQRLRNMIANAGNNNGNRSKFTAALAPTLQRYQNSGQWLQKTSFSANDNFLRDLENLQKIRRDELAVTMQESQRIQKELNDQSALYTTSVSQGKAIWSEMQQVANHLESMDEQLANAEAVMSGFSNIESSQLTRIWVKHLADCKAELESLLFKSKANEMGAIQGSPKAILAEPLVDAGTLKDYEDYISSLDMIQDALSDEEYDLLEEIGRLGLSMSYVPGTARVFSLLDLSERNRIVAYRNLIEEILSQGQKLSNDSRDATFAIPGIGPIIIEDRSDLAEMKELLRHLADSRLNFKYGGGN